MSRTVRNLRAAREELAAAVRWYEEQRPGLGADLFDGVTSATSLVESQPNAGRFDTETNTRRVLVQRFPYEVVYYLTDNEIVVVAVAHSKRRPGYWRDRV